MIVVGIAEREVVHLERDGAGSLWLLRVFANPKQIVESNTTDEVSHGLAELSVFVGSVFHIVKEILGEAHGDYQLGDQSPDHPHACTL